MKPATNSVANSAALRCASAHPRPLQPLLRLLTALGHPVIVANARKLRAISQSQTKSDREDAQMLARLGRADPKLLGPVRHRTEETQRALVRLKVREALVRSRVNLVNSVRFLLKSLGVFVSSSI